MASVVRCTVSVAGGTTQVTSVRNLQDRKAAMLLMIGTETTVKRTAPPDWSMKLVGVLRSFIVIPDAFIVFDICGNQNPTHTMLRAAFLHPDFIVLKYNLRVNAS